MKAALLIALLAAPLAIPRPLSEAQNLAQHLETMASMAKFWAGLITGVVACLALDCFRREKP